MESTYDDMQAVEPSILRQLPRCALAHVATGVLNAVLIDTIKNVNRKPRLVQEPSPLSLYNESLCLPAPIYDYIEFVASTLSPLGDVRVNVPVIAVPQEPVAAAGQMPAQPSGGFGSALQVITLTSVNLLRLSLISCHTVLYDDCA